MFQNKGENKSRPLLIPYKIIIFALLNFHAIQYVHNIGYIVSIHTV